MEFRRGKLVCELFGAPELTQVLRGGLPVPELGNVLVDGPLCDGPDRVADAEVRLPLRSPRAGPADFSAEGSRVSLGGD
eukprot:68939-Alexandrium_andersonii.AAC.1